MTDRYREALLNIVQAARSQDVDLNGQHWCLLCDRVEKYGHADWCIVKIAEEALQEGEGKPPA